MDRLRMAVLGSTLGVSLLAGGLLFGGHSASADPGNGNNDLHVFDVEAEIEALPRPDQAANALIQSFRTSLPRQPIGYAPIGSIRNHLRAPYRQFTDAGACMLPQAYFTGFGWTPQRTLTELYADLKTYALTQQPVFPAYEDAPTAGAGASAQDVTAFILMARAFGATGISVWSYEHLDEAGWQRVAAAARLLDPEPYATLSAQLSTSTAERNALITTIANVKAALGVS